MKTLKVKPMNLSRLFCVTAVAVFLAVAPGCGGPLEDEAKAPTQGIEGAPSTASGQSVPGYCSPDMEYARSLCHTQCAEQFSECSASCSVPYDAECDRQCTLQSVGCRDACDIYYCGGA